MLHLHAYRYVLFLLLTVAFGSINAQSPADWWYFGNQAGVHFENGGPVADTNGKLNTIEGCASVSDGFGNLLFYTDGTWVFNAVHDTMPHGDSLLGNGSSTQSSVIVPYPGNNERYCIFTARGCSGGSSTGQSGFYFAYSVIDMTLEGGLGDVDTNLKNIILFDSASEKCCATTHANGSDLWVIGREQDSTEYYAYHLSSSGIIDTVVSNIGSSTASCAGYITASHEGDRIATAAFGYGVELFDFDQQTGVLSNPVSFGHSWSYGIHFSPNDSLLYVGALNNGVYQYDLTASNIQASEYVVSSTGSAAIAEGPNEKLYITSSGYQYLSEISDPNIYGSGCNFVDTAVYLMGRLGYYGLPNNVAPGLFLISGFQFSNYCLRDTMLFSLDTTDVDYVHWNFGDPASGASNTSSSFFPAHLFTDTGEYTVTLIATRDTVSDTAVQTIVIYPRQSIYLGPDTNVCIGTEVIFDASQSYSSFMWHDSTTADTFSTAGDTFIKVTVFGFCDTVSDSVNITYDDSITFELGPDTVLCGGNGFVIDGNLDPKNATVWWNTNDSTNTLLAIESGEYIMNAENTCGSLSDTIEVSFIPIPNVSLLPNDTINCFDNEIVLTRPDEDSTTYIWSDSTTKKTYTVDTTEVVWLAAFNECGATVDTMRIFYNGEIISELGPDTTICSDDSIVLNAFSPGATYLWNTGDTADSVVTLSEGMLYVVTVSQGFCTTIESRQVELSPVFCPGIDCRLYTLNVFSPNGDGVNDIWRVRIDCDIYEYDLRIYNRWGQLVHQSSNSNFGWDGTINGEFAPDGVYYYDVQYKDNVAVDVDRFSYRGSLTLYR